MKPYQVTVFILGIIYLIFRMAEEYIPHEAVYIIEFVTTVSLITALIIGLILT